MKNNINEFKNYLERNWQFVIAVILLLIISGLILFTVYSATSTLSGSNNIVDKQQSKAEAKTALSNPNRSVASMNLFGKEEAAQSQRKAPSSYKLMGIFAAAGDSSASAIIKVGGNPEELYSVNDAISNGVTVTKIDIDKVIILRNGAREVLILNEEKLEPIATTAATVDKNTPKIKTRGNNRTIQFFQQRLKNLELNQNDAPEDVREKLKVLQNLIDRSSQE